MGRNKYELANCVCGDEVVELFDGFGVKLAGRGPYPFFSIHCPPQAFFIFFYFLISINVISCSISIFASPQKALYDTYSSQHFVLLFFLYITPTVR